MAADESGPPSLSVANLSSSASMAKAISRYSSTPRPPPMGRTATPPVAKLRAGSGRATAGRKSGTTSPAMTTRIARMAAMMRSPPETTRREARRSNSSRRVVRLPETGSGRADGPPALSASVLIATLLDLVQLFFGDGRRDREVAVLDHVLLPVLREYQLHELAGQRVERLAGRLVDVDVEEAGQRIRAGVGVVGSGLHALATVFLRERDGLHVGRGVADAAVADGVAIHRDSLHHRGRPGLLLHRVLVVAVLQRVLLEEAVGAGRRVAPVETDGPARPVAGQAELTPRRDVVLGALPPGLGEHRIGLGDGHALDRIVLVDEDRQRVDGRTDLRGLVTVLLLELVDLGALHRSGHGAELRGAGDQCRRRRRRALALDLDLRVRIELPEGFRPVRHQVVEGVRPDARDVSAHAADGLVGGQLGIDLHLGARYSRQDDQPGRRGRDHSPLLHGLSPLSASSVQPRCFNPMTATLQTCST